MLAPDQLAIASESGATPQVLRWRAFGGDGDLDLDFHGDDRPLLVTRLLARCLSGQSAGKAEETAWRLTLAARIGGLIAIVARTFRTDLLPAHPACGACHQAFEIELPLANLMHLAQTAEREPVMVAELDPGESLTVRRPTGADQRRWRTLRFASRAGAEAGIFSSLISARTAGKSPAPDSGALARMAEILDNEDPLTAFRVSCACPACGHEANYSLDLEGLLLQHLEARQRSMTLEVHRLASRYGWTESEILRIPPQRRANYLRLVDHEAGLP